MTTHYTKHAFDLAFFWGGGGGLCSNGAYLLIRSFLKPHFF